MQCTCLRGRTSLLLSAPASSTPANATSSSVPTMHAPPKLTLSKSLSRACHALVASNEHVVCWRVRILYEPNREVSSITGVLAPKAVERAVARRHQMRTPSPAGAEPSAVGSNRYATIEACSSYATASSSVAASAAPGAARQRCSVSVDASACWSESVALVLVDCCSCSQGRLL